MTSQLVTKLGDREHHPSQLECQRDLPDHVYARHLIAAVPAHVREHFVRDLELREAARELAHEVDLSGLAGATGIAALGDLDALDDADELDDLDELSERSHHGLAREAFVDLAETRGGARIDVRTGGRVPARLARTREVIARLAPKVLVPLAAVTLLVVAMGGTWSTASATPAAPWSATRPPSPPPAGHPGTAAASRIDEPPPPHAKISRKDLTGKLNLNTASEDQLMMLPSVGPSKAERIATWRKKNGGFKRTADLRRVKGFGYKTFKKLEPFLDIKGDTTLAAK
jgi:competence ComEA-like helix-hairpin-helix protein